MAHASSIRTVFQRRPRCLACCGCPTRISHSTGLYYALLLSADLKQMEQQIEQEVGGASSDASSTSSGGSFSKMARRSATPATCRNKNAEWRARDACKEYCTPYNMTRWPYSATLPCPRVRCSWRPLAVHMSRWTFRILCMQGSLTTDFAA
jgi:hypothetical protein